MARKLKPCGTPAAYERHRAHGEDPCDDCKRGMAAYRAERRGHTTPPPEEQTMDHIAPDLFPAARPDVDIRDIDISEEQRRLYFILDAALPQAMPREVSSLVREMRGLLQDIHKSHNGDEGETKSLEQQLAEARANRAERDASAAKDRGTAATS